jgi:large subunit GTPase 1
MGFRCVDLEKYVSEVGSDRNDGAVPGKGQRRSLLLINKADLLTIEQRYVNSFRNRGVSDVDDRSMWADHFEKQNITYAFFSAADAAAAQEQAERMWRRENDIESESEDENEDEDEEVEGDHSGSEGEVESEDDEEEEDEVEEELSKKVQDTTLDSDYEEGWSTEGEDETAEGKESALDKKVANGDKIPMKDVVKEINHWEIKEEKPVTEDKRTRVLSVTELENLFVNAAPELHRE